MATQIQTALNAPTGLLVIDMQNGFCHPEGAVAMAGFEIGHQRAAIANVAKLVSASRTAGVAVLPDLHAATMKNVDLFHGVVVRTEELVSALASESGMPSPARRAN